jgi:hypothetical protein
MEHSAWVVWIENVEKIVYSTVVIPPFKPRLAQAGMFSHWLEDGSDGRVGVGGSGPTPLQQSKVTPSTVTQHSASKAQIPQKIDC